MRSTFMPLDHKTTLSLLKSKVQKFCEDRDWDKFHGAKDLAIGIITEASELLEHFRFKDPSEVEQLFKTPKSKQKISEELADILLFTLRLAQRYQIDITSELNKKLKKNARRYPIAKCKGKNKKYSELE